MWKLSVSWLKCLPVGKAFSRRFIPWPWIVPLTRQLYGLLEHEHSSPGQIDTTPMGSRTRNKGNPQSYCHQYLCLLELFLGYNIEWTVSCNTMLDNINKNYRQLSEPSFHGHTTVKTKRRYTAPCCWSSRTIHSSIHPYCIFVLAVY